MSNNATGRAQGPAQKLIHDHDDADRPKSTPDELSDPGPFTEWLAAQRGRPDFVGDLSRGMNEDGNRWPEPVTYADVERFMNDLGAAPFVEEATWLAWCEWRALRREARRRSQ